MKIVYKEILDSLPEDWREDLIPKIREINRKMQTTLVVLDDDPTGTQTVYDIPVLTEWTEERIQCEFEAGRPLFYILTNSRCLHEQSAIALAKEIGGNLRAASVATGRQFRVISRSDSTLRGHYPAEVIALEKALGMEKALQVIMPFFLEGGRLTINDTHYVREGEYLIPAGETSFAQDATFGYRTSDLKHWVEEKSRGFITNNEVCSITLDDIRRGGPDIVAEKLRNTEARACIINAVSMRDVEVVALSVLMAEQEGATLIYRTAASMVQALAGLYPKPLLKRQDLGLAEKGGALIIIGSYQPKSTAQLEHLVNNTDVVSLMVDVQQLLNQSIETDSGALARKIDEGLQAEKNVVLYTSREVVTGDDAATSLDIVGRVSAFLVEVVAHIAQRPRYILSKGGITSSDIASKSLNVKQAEVLGQVLPGVPAWRLGPESQFDGLVYIVFPGNVGEVDAISEVVKRF